jgi:hypothetical protein
VPESVRGWVTVFVTLRALKRLGQATSRKHVTVAIRLDHNQRLSIPQPKVYLRTNTGQRHHSFTEAQTVHS